MTVDYARLQFDNIPTDWVSVEARCRCGRARCGSTRSYDADVAKFFRTMGQGYQARMNAVLRAYMLAILSRAIPSKKNEDWMGREI